MIEHLINSVAHAFELVVGLVGGGLDGVFEAVGDLSSNIF